MKFADNTLFEGIRKNIWERVITKRPGECRNMGRRKRIDLEKGS